MVPINLTEHDISSENQQFGCRLALFGDGNPVAVAFRQRLPISLG